MGVAVEGGEGALELAPAADEHGVGGHRHALAEEGFLDVVGAEQGALAPAGGEGGGGVAGAADPQAGHRPVVADGGVGAAEQGAAGLGDGRGEAVVAGQALVELGGEGDGGPVAHRAGPAEGGGQAGADQGAGEGVGGGGGVARAGRGGGAEAGGQEDQPGHGRAQRGEEGGGVGGGGAEVGVFEQQHRARRLPAGAGPGVVAVAGEVQHRRPAGGFEVVGEGPGLAALVHQQVEVGAADGLEDGGFLGFVVELVGAVGGGGHEGEAEAVVVGGVGGALGADAAQGAVLEQGVVGPEAVGVGEELPRGVEHGPVGGLGPAAGAVDGEQQGRRGFVGEAPQQALGPVEPVVEVAPEGEQGGGLAPVGEGRVAGAEALERGDGVSVEDATGADGLAVGEEGQGVVLDE